jgi:hypothetical protein
MKNEYEGKVEKHHLLIIELRASRQLKMSELCSI